jgi:rhodanese-related sulfurtransferase
MAAHDPEFLGGAAEARSRIVELSPDEVDALHRQGVVVLDVRSPSDYEDAHLSGAIPTIPLCQGLIAHGSSVGP